MTNAIAKSYMAIFPPAISRQALASTLVLYYLPALYPVLPFKSGASAFTSNHQTLPAPGPTIPRQAISPLDFPCLTLIPFPSPLQIATPLYWNPLELAQKHMQSVCECVSAATSKRTPRPSPLIYTPYISAQPPRPAAATCLLACLLAS
jgi:hypothetical protein